MCINRGGIQKKLFRIQVEMFCVCVMTESGAFVCGKWENRAKPKKTFADCNAKVIIAVRNFHEK